VISDIHSNIEALNAVLNSIKSNNCDKIICLGDLVGYGPRPNEVIEKISELNIDSIMGNYDEAVGFYLPYCGCHLDSKVKYLQSQNSLRWTEENTNEENKVILRQLPEELVFNYKGNTISAYHGSPYSITEYIYDNQQDRLHEVLNELHTDILLLGHTHLPYIKWVGEKLIINPGSVGKPKDGDNKASYVLLELNDKVNAEVIKVTYDIDKVIEDMNKTSLLKEFGEMLRLGRML